MIASYHMAYHKMVTFNSITLTIITSLFSYLRMYIYIYSKKISATCRVVLITR